MNLKRNTLILTLAVVVMFGGRHAYGADGTIVIPNGFETLEGNSWQSANLEDTTPPGFRQQFIISHLQFKSLNGSVRITGVQNRPDARVTSRRSFTYSNVEIRMSTTEKTPETMSTRFANNIGADETLVYDGDIILSTEGAKGLKGFEYVIDFQNPFYYDPAEGDMVFEFKCSGGFSGSPSNSPVMDGQWFEDRTMFAYLSTSNPNGTIGTITGDWLFIFRFTYQPVRSDELQGDINGDKKAGYGDICFMIENWRKNQPFCDIAPEPLGDGIVDEQDLMLLAEYIDVGSLVIESEPIETNVDMEDATLVIPNGFDYLEGNSWQVDNVGDLYPSGAREQEIFSSEQFASIGGPIWITGAYYRPDMQVTTPREFTYFGLEVRMSTTDKTPATLSNTFSENIGSDETLVYSGDCTLSTSGRDGLEDFDYVIKYHTPFYYDPGKGSLLSEYWTRGASSGTPTNSPVFDGQWFSNRTHFGFVGTDNPDSERGNISGNWSAIFQFAYHPVRCPDLMGDLNGDGTADSEDIYFLINQWQTDDAICDICPEPAGDGIVDIHDLIQLAGYLNLEPPAVYWRLDESEGDIAYDSIGMSDALVIGDAAWQPEGGNLAGALEFDGIDDYIETDFALNPTTTSFSALAWIKGGAPGQAIISQADTYKTAPGVNVTVPGSLWLGVDSNQGGFMTDLMGNYFDSLESDSVIKDGLWHHIGLVYDFAAMRRYLYLDGVEVAVDTDFVGGAQTTGAVYIGAGPDLDPTNYFSGLVDDVRIYERVLSKEEIAALAR